MNEVMVCLKFLQAIRVACQFAAQRHGNLMKYCEVF